MSHKRTGPWQLPDIGALSQLMEVLSRWPKWLYCFLAEHWFSEFRFPLILEILDPPLFLFILFKSEIWYVRKVWNRLLILMQFFQYCTYWIRRTFSLRVFWLIHWASLDFVRSHLGMQVSCGPKLRNGWLKSFPPMSRVSKIMFSEMHRMHWAFV